MPTGYRIHEGAGLVLFGGAGPLTLAEWQQTLDQAVADPRYQSGFLTAHSSLSGAPTRNVWPSGCRT